MKIRYSRTMLWIGYLGIAYLLGIAGMAVFDMGVRHETFSAFMEGSGPMPIVIGIFALLVGVSALGKHNVVVIELGDDALGYRARNRQWVTLPYRAMREARVVASNYRQRGIFRLHVVMDDGQETIIDLNSLERSAGEIFQALKGHVPHLVQPDPNQPKLG